MRRYLAKLLLPAIFLSPDSHALSWEKCVEQTAQNNPELRAAKETLLSAQLTVRGAHSGFFPTLQASLGYNYGNSATGGNGNQSTYTASLNASQNLFSGMNDLALVNRAGGRLREAEATAQATRARVHYDLKVAFAGVNFAERSHSLQEEIVQRRQANLRLVELRFQSGRENKGSAMLSNAYLEQARLDLLQATNTRETQKAALARVMGEEIPPGFAAGDEPAMSDPPENTVIESLVTQTPDYRRAVAQEAITDAQVVIARSGFFPTLNVTGATGNSDQRFFPGNNRWSVGASLVLPLFNGGKDYYATRSAAADHRAATLAQQNALRAGRTTLRDVLAKFREAVQKLKVDRTFAEAVATRAKIAREKYNNGLLSFEDWDVIENDLIARQRAYLQSQRDRIIAEAAWEQATGRGVFQ